MKKLILERVTDRDKNGYAIYKQTVKNERFGITESRITTSNINRRVDMHFDSKYDITIFDDD